MAGAEPPRDEQAAGDAEPIAFGFETSRDPRPAATGVRVFVWAALGVIALGIAAIIVTAVIGLGG